MIDDRLLNRALTIRDPLFRDRLILQRRDLFNDLNLRRTVLFPDRVEIRQEIRR